MQVISESARLTLSSTGVIIHALDGNHLSVCHQWEEKQIIVFYTVVKQVGRQGSHSTKTSSTIVIHGDNK